MVVWFCSVLDFDNNIYPIYLIYVSVFSGQTTMVESSNGIIIIRIGITLCKHVETFNC